MLLKNRMMVIAGILLIASIYSKAIEPDLPALTDIFTGGKDGFPVFRIPALITTARGSLLAFAEGRANLHDHAENKIVLKRSDDDGKTWGPIHIIAEDGANALNNPTAVVLRKKNRVILMYQRYAKGFDERNAEPGLDGPHVCRTFTIHSDNNGLKWSQPVEITAQVKRPTEITSTATGPGRGIELTRGKHAGRILMPFNQGPYGHWKVYAAFSDDGGESWHYGETASEESAGFANEVQFVEWGNGDVMLNARNERGEKYRKTAVSNDAGETWSATHLDPTLIDPGCQASLLRYAELKANRGDIFLFSNPASQTERKNGTIRLSFDQGKSWPIAKVLYSGSFSYSCLTPLPSGFVGCLFERDGMKKISFARFSVDWVEGNASK
jgi:sialidase-1